MKFLKRFWWIILLVLIVGGGFWRYRSAQAKAKEGKSYTVKRQNLTEALSLSGEIDAKQKADVKFQTSGLLTWVGVKEGDSVKKYQSLAALDKRELQNSMAQYLNNYMKERWDFEQGVDDNRDWETRGMTDAARDAVKRTLQKNQFDLNNSVLTVESKDLAMKFATIFAPFEGIITKIDVPVPGTNITPAGATFSIVNPKSLFFSATADQTEVPSFKQGMTGKIALDSFPEKEFPATVDTIGFIPKAGESGTVYEIKINFDPTEASASMKMGMTGDVSFILREIKDVLAVPEAYIKKVNGKYFVNKMIQGKLTESEITQGAIIDGMVEIKEGLNENDVIYNQP